MAANTVLHGGTALTVHRSAAFVHLQCPLQPLLQAQLSSSQQTLVVSGSVLQYTFQPLAAPSFFLFQSQSAGDGKTRRNSHPGPAGPAM